MKKLNTILNKSGVQHVLAVHVSNMLNTPKITAKQVTAIVANLEATYGSDLVEATIAKISSQFYVHYYGILKPLSKASKYA